MKMIRFALLLTLLCVLFGCSHEALMEELTPKADVEYAKKYFALLQSQNYEAIADPLDPKLKTDQLQSQLEQIAQFFPSDPPINIQLIGSNTVSIDDKVLVELTFQYEFPSTWLLANIHLERFGDGEYIVNGVNVRKLQSSLEENSKFTLAGKSMPQYAFLAIVVLVFLFTLTTFIVCLRTPIKKRKWLWAIFTLVGFVQIQMNWATGVVSFNPISLLLFGAGFYSGQFSPAMLSVTAPVGAVIFWLRRGKFLKEEYDNEVDDEEFGA